MRAYKSPAPKMQAMTSSYDICIRGGGIVGHTLALLLARDRWRVALVANTPAATAGKDVRAYALNAKSKHLLESVKCWPDAVHATAVQRMDVFGDREGRVQFSAASLAVDALTWIVDVAPLEALLSQAARYQPSLDVMSDAVDAPLTVICEGKDSPLRQSLGVASRTSPYPQRAVAARLRAQQGHGQVARQWFHEGNILALLPTEGVLGHEVALVWSLPEQRAHDMQHADADVFAQAVASACAHALGPMTLTSKRQSWALQSTMAERWFGRWPQSGSSSYRAWVLAGDAAHTVHPLAGQGLNLGLADALELTDLLRNKAPWRSVADLQLLRRYERSRRTQATATDLTLNGLQKLFAQEHPALQRLRNLGMQGFERMNGLKTWVARQAMGI